MKSEITAWICMTISLIFAAIPALAELPIIAFVFADDLVWGDPGAYGNRRSKTPHLGRRAVAAH